MNQIMTECNIDLWNNNMDNSLADILKGDINYIYLCCTAS